MTPTGNDSEPDKRPARLSGLDPRAEGLAMEEVREVLSATWGAPPEAVAGLSIERFLQDGFWSVFSRLQDDDGTVLDSLERALKNDDRRLVRAQLAMVRELDAFYLARLVSGDDVGNDECPPLFLPRDRTTPGLELSMARAHVDRVLHEADDDEIRELAIWRLGPG